MSKRSVKFTEWIAPEYNIDIDEAKNFIDQIKGKPQRAHKAPDVFSPAKELEREKELKAGYQIQATSACGSNT